MTLLASLPAAYPSSSTSSLPGALSSGPSGRDPSAPRGFAKALGEARSVSARPVRPQDAGAAAAADDVGKESTTLTGQRSAGPEPDRDDAEGPVAIPPVSPPFDPMAPPPMLRNLPAPVVESFKDGDSARAPTTEAVGEPADERVPMREWSPASPHLRQADSAGRALTFAAMPGRDEAPLTRADDARPPSPGPAVQAQTARRDDAVEIPAALPVSAAHTEAVRNRPQAAPQSLALVAPPKAQGPAERAVLSAPGSAAFAGELATHVSSLVREGAEKAHLQLSPAELGPLEVQIRREGDAAQVVVRAERPSTQQSLEQAMPALSHALRDAGLTLTDLGLPNPGEERGTAETLAPAAADAVASVPLPTALNPIVANLPAPAELPELTLKHAPGSAAFDGELATRLTTLVRDGIEQARLQLNPVEMGPVEVRIQIDGDAARVVMMADLASTRQSLEQAMPTLASSLRETGLTLTGGGVFEQAHGQAGSGAFAQGQDGGFSRPRRPQPEGPVALPPELSGKVAPKSRGVVDLVA